MFGPKGSAFGFRDPLTNARDARPLHPKSKASGDMQKNFRLTPWAVF